MPEPCYDVFEFDEPAFKLVSDAEIRADAPVRQSISAAEWKLLML